MEESLMSFPYLCKQKSWNAGGCLSDWVQMEEIESLNRIPITGQTAVYTVGPFQLSPDTNKTEKRCQNNITLLGFGGSKSGSNGRDKNFEVIQPADFLLSCLLMRKYAHGSCTCIKKKDKSLSSVLQIWQIHLVELHSKPVFRQQ